MTDLNFYKTTTPAQGVSVVHKQFAAHAQMESIVKNKNNAFPWAQNLYNRSIYFQWVQNVK